MPNTVTRKPLDEQEKKKLLLMVKEMEARNLPLPNDIKELLEEGSKKFEWPVDRNGYFVKRDGKRYEPSEQQKAFIDSKARYGLFYGSRGSGKSGAGAQKALKKIMQGESGA